MTIHLLIIDALNLIRRIHSVQGSPCLPTCQRSIEQLYQHTLPTHAVAVFDDKNRANGWRSRLYPAYKEGRKPMPDSLQSELPLLQQAFEQFGLTCWQQEETEADDLIATLALKVSQHGHQVTIISTDKGYCQLQNEHIQIRDYFQKRWLDRAFIEREFGVLPQQLVDYWGLTGVGSSNISGVAGIGAKSAAELISQFGSLDEIYRRLEEVPVKWRNKLSGDKEAAYLSKRLATLKTDIPLNKNLQQLRVTASGQSK
jgi:protein Xni